MKKVIIYSASDFAEEVAWTIEAMNATQNEYAELSIYGFIDDSIKEKKGLNILGTGEWLVDRDLSEFYFIVAVGNPEVKKRIVKYLDALRVNYVNVIYPNTIHAKDIKLGEGIYIGAGNIITTGVEIQDHVIINLNCTIGHKTIIEKYSCINPACNISGGVHVEEGVYVGTNAVILQNKTIGRYSTIGASAMVNKDVMNNSKMLGVPARKV
jgi:sugar O-acyltransferase (sialic acid O-acetyltransferase NeuD family)